MDTFVTPQHKLRKLDFRTESPQTIMPHNDNDNFLYYLDDFSILLLLNF